MVAQGYINVPVAGTYTFGVTAADSATKAQTKSVTYSITVAPQVAALAISSTALARNQDGLTESRTTGLLLQISIHGLCRNSVHRAVVQMLSQRPKRQHISFFASPAPDTENRIDTLSAADCDRMLGVAGKRTFI